MKSILPAFLLFWFSLSAAGQDVPGSNSVLPFTDHLQRDSVISNFNEKFKTEEERTDFKSLRNYLSEREGLLAALRNTSASLHRNSSLLPSTLASTKVIIQRLDNLIKGRKDKDSVQVHLASVTNNFALGWYPFDEFANSNPDSEKRMVWVSVEQLKAKLSGISSYLVEANAAAKRMRTVDRSIEAVEKDVNDCRRQIDIALAPEYKEQDFRKQITLYFSLLIALMLVSFFLIVHRNAGNELSKNLLSSNGLQFITLFVLIIAVILFGILSILQSSELAAILAGISGYILGRGAQKNDAAGGAGS
ncbi:MAG TPA: hypothetical protein VF598_08655 [Hymenobacter sp.]|jgi:hypothetical protein